MSATDNGVEKTSLKFAQQNLAAKEKERMTNKKFREWREKCGEEKSFGKRR